MHAVSLSLQVNPSGASPLLNQEQVWKGLIMKAENAVLFVPAMASCQILEHYKDGLLREISIFGSTFKERVTFTPKVEVYFERVDTEEHAGWISNVISESDHGLMLTFTFAVNFSGITPGTEEEQIQVQKMKSTYKAAIEATLQKIRQLVEEKRF